MDSPQLPLPPTTSQAMLNRREAAQDWEARKAIITELYSYEKLAGVMRIMREEHEFNATVNQYKKQFDAWGLNKKYTRSKEYDAMILKARKRKRETPGKETAFRLRGKEIKSSEIIRYARRNEVGEDDVESEITTPSDLSCCTPPPSLSNTQLTDIETFTTRIRTPTPVMQSTSRPVQTPLIAVSSPRLSSFKWFNAYCDDESKRTGRIIKFEGSPIKNLLGGFVKAVDSYEDRRMYRKTLKVHGASVDCLPCKFRNALNWVGNISINQQKIREVEFLIGMLFEGLLLHIGDDNYIVPSEVKAIEINAAVEIAIRGLYLYLKIGKVGEAVHIVSRTKLHELISRTDSPTNWGLPLLENVDESYDSPITIAKECVDFRFRRQKDFGDYHKKTSDMDFLKWKIKILKGRTDLNSCCKRYKNVLSVGMQTEGREVLELSWERGVALIRI